MYQQPNEAVSIPLCPRGVQFSPDEPRNIPQFDVVISHGLVLCWWLAVGFAVVVLGGQTRQCRALSVQLLLLAIGECCLENHVEDCAVSLCLLVLA
jgi:hypothetical protein